MERAVQFNNSRLDKIFYGLCLVLASYWLWSANIALSLRLVALSVLVVLAVIHCLRPSKGLTGSYRLSSSGQLVSLTNTQLEEKKIYQVAAQQRLPWCLDIQFKSMGETGRQLVWIDSLSSEDWRKFRVFLTEECQKSR